MSKIRIYEYAKECGVPSKKVIEFLQARNIEVKSHMKSLEDISNWMTRRSRSSTHRDTLHSQRCVHAVRR